MGNKLCLHQPKDFDELLEDTSHDKELAFYGKAGKKNLWKCTKCGSSRGRTEINQWLCSKCLPKQIKFSKKKKKKISSVKQRNIPQTLLCKIEIQSDPGMMIDHTELNVSTNKGKIGMTYSFVTETILNHLHTTRDPMRFKINAIENLNNEPISLLALNVDNIALVETNNILELSVVMDRYQHQIAAKPITCQQMIRKNSQNVSDCDIYVAMKDNYEWNEKNLKHLTYFTHFTNDCNQKTQCRHFAECKAYKRLEEGGNELKDRCHIELYRHPPRTRNIQLSQNINPLIISQSEMRVRGVYEPTDNDKQIHRWTKTDGFLQALLTEIEANGYASDLCIDCAGDDECKHDNLSLLNIVEDKIKDKRHAVRLNVLNKAEMLSLILYTGCECNYDLCKTQRMGDYSKWKWFDYCLYHAIHKLSVVESGSFPVFSGLNRVKLDKLSVKRGYFVTYVSTSWSKTVAHSFMQDDGMIIEIDKEFKNASHTYCCDVSWISKFPDECEILFARSTDKTWMYDGFKCSVVDESNGVQTVSLIDADT